MIYKTAYNINPKGPIENDQLQNEIDILYERINKLKENVNSMKFCVTFNGIVIFIIILFLIRILIKFK